MFEFATIAESTFAHTGCYFAILLALVVEICTQLVEILSIHALYTYIPFRNLNAD